MKRYILAVLLALSVLQPVLLSAMQPAYADDGNNNDNDGPNNDHDG